MTTSKNIQVTHYENGSLQEISCTDIDGFQIILAAYFKDSASVRVTFLTHGTEENTCQIQQAVIEEKGKGKEYIPPGDHPKSILAVNPQAIAKTFHEEGLPPPLIG